MVGSLGRCKNLNISLLQKVTILNSYMFSKVYYFLYASYPDKKFFKKCDQIQRWFLSATKEPFNPKKVYIPRMALSRFWREKKMGGFNLVSVQAKYLGMKIRMFARFINEDGPVGRHLKKQLTTFDKPGKPCIIFRVKRKPIRADPFIASIMEASKILKLRTIDETSTASNELNGKFLCSEKMVNVLDSPLKTVAALRDTLNDPLVLSSKQTVWKEEHEIDFPVVWSYLSKKKKVRAHIRSFLMKIWNGILFFPDHCPLCGIDVLF
jgi:hypothetical protein